MQCRTDRHEVSNENGGPPGGRAIAALQADSPAINAGDESVCAEPPVNDLDQRGYVRPGAGHAQCSIGAYEADATPPQVCTGDCDGTGSAPSTRSSRW
jgi:hypothetical protein